MKLVTFGIDKDRNLIIKFPVFIQPIIGQNMQAHFYTHIQVDRPYTALNTEIYITVRQQELRTCKRMSYEFYCAELLVVKHKSKHSCKSAIYFDLDSEIIIENCKFHFHYNKTDVTPTVLDGGNEMILANWPNDKCIICSINNDIPIRIPSYPYVLVNRSILCNCGIEAENNFRLESLAACHDSYSKFPGKCSFCQLPGPN